MNSNMLYLGKISSWPASGSTLVTNVTLGAEGLKTVMMVSLKCLNSRQQGNNVVPGLLAG